MTVELNAIAEELRKFAAERDWNQFHSPKNLAMALNVEAGELLEIFQWLSEAQSRELSTEQMAQVEEEIADVQLYLIRMADLLGVDLLAACRRKIESNGKKYPADRVRGSSKKYSQYATEGSPQP